MCTQNSPKTSYVLDGMATDAPGPEGAELAGCLPRAAHHPRARLAPATQAQRAQQTTRPLGSAACHPRVRGKGLRGSGRHLTDEPLPRVP